MIYKVKKDFKYTPHYGPTDIIDETTEFHKGEVYEFEPYMDPYLPNEKQTDGEMICKTMLYPKCNNGFVWDSKYFNEHFAEVNQDNVVMYGNDHNLLFGHTVNKIDQFGNCGQEYHPNISAIDRYNYAINNVMESIDYAYKMDMNYMIAQYNLANTNKKIYKDTLKQLLDDYSEANIEKAKFILENVH